MAEMNVPYLDMRAPYLELKTQIDQATERFFTSGWYVLGKETENFEAAYAKFCGAKHCIGLGNGLDALKLILEAYGIGAGDEVIVPANTYIASWLAVSYCGALPVPVEPNPQTFNIDPAQIEAAVTQRTKAVMAVHLYGQTCEMELIRAVCQKYGILLIEDGAQAHGAYYQGKRAGSLADGAGVSLYPGKNLGAFGDAGLVLTDDERIADKIFILRNYGSRTKYMNEVKGYNSRLDEMQAALLLEKLKFLDEWNARRKKIAQAYLSGLNGIADLQLPLVAEGCDSVWHIFAIHTPKRDDLSAYLKDQGIGTMVHYPIPPHLSAAYAELGFEKGCFPITERLAQQELSLPIGPHMSAEQCEYTIGKIHSFFERG